MATHRRIAEAVLTVGAFVLLGRLFGAAREIMLAARYGAGDIVDAYVLVSSIASWPVAVWMSTLTVFAIPLLVRAGNETHLAANSFTAELVRISFWIGISIAVAMFIALRLLAETNFWDLSTGGTTAMKQMLGPLVLTVPLGLLVTVLSVRLMSQGRHINTLLDGMPALVVSTALLLIAQLPAQGLAWATVAGLAIQAVILARLLAGQGLTLRGPLQLETPQWQSMRTGLAFFMAGQLAVGAIAFIDPIMVASQGTGAVATYGYANRILALSLGITATAVARAVLPAFAQLSGETLARTAKQWIIGLLAAGVACAAIGWALAPWVVQLLFERGQFTPENTVSVTAILRVGLLQLPFYLGGIVAVQVLAAQGRQAEITKSGFLNVAVKLAANFWFIGSYGIAGAMMATTLMYAIALIYLWRAAFASGGTHPAGQAG